MSNLINKAKAAVSSNKSNNNNNNDYVDNPHSKTAGPHKSDMMNKLDPRVDSDRDHRNDPTSAAGGRGQTQDAGYGATGGLGGMGNQPGMAHSGANAPQTVGGHHSTNAGPHSSNLANTIDPRVDSDRDGSHRIGGAGNQPGMAHNGAHAPGTFGGHQSTNAGPHASNFANTIDPRVDSGRDGSRHIGGTGTQPGLAHTGTHAPGYVTSATPGSGNASNAGPHNSAALNKLDPRVDSDVDGSRTTGGNATMR